MGHPYRTYQTIPSYLVVTWILTDRVHPTDLVMFPISVLTSRRRVVPVSHPTGDVQRLLLVSLEETGGFIFDEDER